MKYIETKDDNISNETSLMFLESCQFDGESGHKEDHKLQENTYPKNGEYVRSTQFLYML